MGLKVLIGGSGSTGSSLLKNILGRHSDIFASQETSIFSKLQVYNDWRITRKRLLSKKWTGLNNFGFHAYDQIDIFPEEILYSRKEIQEILNQSSDIVQFSDRFFGKALKQNKKIHWLEKTPANVYLFHEFLNTFSNSYVIHTVRNPHDTIASLVNRGFSEFYATSLYLLNTAAGLNTRHHDKYSEVVYRELVTESEKSIHQICSKLNIQFESEMLKPNQERHIKTTQLDGWYSDETKEVSVKSLGRFYSLSKEQQELIHTAISVIKVSSYGKKLYKISSNSILDLALELNMTEGIKEIKHPKYINTLRKQMWKDRWRRFKRNSPYSFGDYPVFIDY